MTISARISAALREKGVTQRDVAETVHVAPSTVNTWIKTNSESIPSAYVMPICRLLDMQPEELLEGAEHKEITVKESLPKGYVQLSENELRLVSIFRALDAESQIIVLNAAIVEKRSQTVQGNDGIGTGKEMLGEG